MVGDTQNQFSRARAARGACAARKGALSYQGKPKFPESITNMKTTTVRRLSRSIHLVIGLGAAWLSAVPAARAGLTFELYMYRNNQGQTYQFYTPLSTNATGPDAALGMYTINSPQWPTNGSTRQFLLATNGLYLAFGQEHWSYGDFDTVMQQITNGTWSILFTNATTTNLYTFTVSAPGITSNMLPATLITFPSDGALVLTNQPTFTWQGPSGWPVNINTFVWNSGSSFFEYASLPPSQREWTISTPIPDGINYTFIVQYVTNNATPVFVATTPLSTNSSHQAIAGWVSTSTIETSAGLSFAVTNTVVSVNGHALVAHYPFDDSGYLSQDTSGNGNDLGGGSWWGPNHEFSTNAIAGAGAVLYHGASSLTPSDTTRTNWDKTLAGSFSMSAWVKTTAARGYDDDDAISGATIFWAYNDYSNTNDTIPLAITGSKAAFSTRDHLGHTTTLHSTSSVNDGTYHLIAVTRDSSSGEKRIYIDGNFEAMEVGTTDPLDGNDYYLSIGGTYLSAYTGLLDDVQIYSGVLSASEIAALYSAPGSTSPDVSGTDFNPALNTWGLPWSTGGDSDWLVETTNTFDGVSAAQSGGVTGAQTSTLSVTVTGPGTFSFYWASIADDPNGGFYYEFDIDGSYANDIAGDTYWHRDGPYAIGGGTHKLTWTVHANYDTDPTQAGFLDKVSYVAAQPIVLLNPQYNGTNFQFQFNSQSGFTHAVQYRTTLVTGADWQTYMYITGNDGLMNVAIPLWVFGASKQGFVRVATQ